MVTPNSKGWASRGVPKVQKSCQGTAWLVYWMCNNWIQIHGNVTPFICLLYPFQYNVYLTPVRTRGNPDPQRGILVFSLWYDTSPCVSTVRMSPLTRGLVIGPMTSSSPECLPFETSVPHHVEGLPPRGCFPGASHCPTLEESPSHLSRLPLQWSHRDSYFLYAWWWPTWGPSRMAGFPTGAFHYFNYHS